MNAIRVDMALGGSTNTVLHLMAIATEANVPLSLADFNRISDEIPHICDMQPSGPIRCRHFTGPEISLQSLQLTQYLEDAQSVSGKSVLTIARDAVVKNQHIIQTVQESVHSPGGLKILSGSLAPDGAVVKCAAVPQEMWRHTGPARVFDGETPAMKAILAREIKEGDVAIIRYEGPRGAPDAGNALANIGADGSWIQKSCPDYRWAVFRRNQGPLHRACRTGICCRRPDCVCAGWRYD